MRVRGLSLQIGSPAVPTGLTITGVTDTTISLSWTANVESTFSHYNLYRSTDGVNYGLPYVEDILTNSYIDTGLTPATTYYYKLTAESTLGIESSFSSVVSQETTNEEGLTWSSNLPNPIQFDYGVPSVFDFDPYISGTPGLISVETGVLPPNVTIVGQTLSYDGGGSTAGHTETNVSFRLESNPDLDWQVRSEAAGVFYSNNFTWRDQAKTLPMTSTAELRSSTYPATSGPNNIAASEFSTVYKLSGAGSYKANFSAAIPGVYADLGFTFDGIGVTTKNTSKHEFYLQFAFYADSVYRNFFYGPHSQWGGKICIVAANNISVTPGSLVFRRGTWQGTGDTRFYYYKGSNGEIANPLLNWPAYSDFTSNIYYDRGTPTVTSLNTLQQRHGPTWSGKDSGTSDPDVLASQAPFIVADGWTVFEIYIKQVTSGNGIIKIWAAPYGQPPVLITGDFDADLPFIGASDGASINPAPMYSGFQLGNYHNTATFWPSVDTFVCYDELIASDLPIKFPGNYDLPYPGTTPPPSFPAGSSLVK